MKFPRRLSIGDGNRFVFIKIIPFCEKPTAHNTAPILYIKGRISGHEVERLRCIFATDLHGRAKRYDAVFEAARETGADAVLLGGDLLPGGASFNKDPAGFLDLLEEKLEALKRDSGPLVFLIMGNDDPRSCEAWFLRNQERGLFSYVHFRAVESGGVFVAGYSYIPPSPFLLKDWEKYDVSRYVDPGCVPPEEGHITAPRPEGEGAATIAEDLLHLAGLSPPGETIYLFHTPPRNSALDRAALDNRFVDHAPLDPHVGSEAVSRFIKRYKPLVTLHGHIHESTGLTGNWQESWGPTHSFSAVHDGEEACIVEFDTQDLKNARRRLVG